MSLGTVAVALSGAGASEPWELYELSIVTAVFGTPQPDLHDPWYELRLCSPSAGERSFGYGLSVSPTHGLADLVTADTVIVPSVPQWCIGGEVEESAELVDALRRASANGARMVALCDGAFALAAAGILDGRRATAHWEHTPILAERYPTVTVDDAVLYIDDGDVLTSAGMTAAVDLCLHLVRRDLGAVAANRLARRMVVPPHRAGGQAQYIDLSVPVTEDEGIGLVLQWANANLDRPLTVAQLARRAKLGPRSFHRRVREATGTTPLRWLLNQRLVHAQSMLESSDAPIERIARLCGLGTAANLRRHFTARVGVSPAQYRRSFRGSRVIASP